MADQNARSAGEDYRMLRVAKWIEGVLMFDTGIPAIDRTEV
jgi:hypothetical protein